MMSDLADNGMFMPPATMGTVPCCICGAPIAPNPANMCGRCLRSRVDITEGLPRSSIINYCPECRSYLHPPRTWVRAEPESKELLAFCLRRLKPLIVRHVRLVHAEFIWTEPHSKRLKLRLRVQREALHGAILEQAHLVELQVHDRLCESCARTQASPDQWTSVVQLRQHVPHRRTFFYLEQLILHYSAAARSIRIRESDRGLDFFFSTRQHGLRFAEFIETVAPVKSNTARQLVSHDSKSNIYNYKYTFSVEISPICREDLICLPPKVAASLGNLGPIVICTKVSESLVLLDPTTLRCAFLNGKQYWRDPFTAFLTGRQLVEYIVLDIEHDSNEVTVAGSKYSLAYAQVARLSDFGRNDNIFTIRTHLGRLLKPGDYALGYDLYAANGNDVEIDKYRNLVLPDAILVKKSYEEKRQRRRGKARRWKLKSLDMEVDATAAKVKGDGEKRDVEYEQFLRDLEENPELRFNVNLFEATRDADQASEIASTVGDDDFPSVPLDELLADLDLNEDEDEEDEEHGTSGMQE